MNQDILYIKSKLLWLWKVCATFEWFEMVLGVRSGLNMWFETCEQWPFFASFIHYQLWRKAINYVTKKQIPQTLN